MDCDGDKLFCCEDDRINRHILSEAERYIPYDAKVDGSLQEDTEENLINYFIKTSVKSEVGKLANFVSSYRDKELSDNMDFDKVIMGLGFLEGWEIDKAKAGYSVDIPDFLKPELIPHWLQGNKAMKRSNGNFFREFDYNSLWNKDSETGKFKCYHSNAPMGLLFDHVFEVSNKIFDRIDNYQGTEYCQLLESIVGIPDAQTYAKLREYCNSYCLEVSNMFKSIEKLQEDEKKKTSNLLMSTISEKYRKLVLSLSDNTLQNAVACYRVSYYEKSNTRRKSPKSFVYNTMFDEFITVIGMLPGAKRLLKLPNRLEGCKKVYINELGMLFDEEDIFVMDTKYIPSGSYDVFTINEKNFIEYISNRKVEYIPEVIADEDKEFQVKLTGFKVEYGNKLIDDVDKLLKDNGVFELQFVNGKLKALINAEIVCGVVANSVVPKEHIARNLIVKNVGDTTMINKKGEVKKAGTLLVQYSLGGVSDTVIKTEETSTVASNDYYYSDVNYEDYSDYDSSFSDYDKYQNDDFDFVGEISNVEII